MTYIAWSVIAGETPTATKWNYLGGNDADFDTRLTQALADETIASASDGVTVTFNMATRRNWHVQIAGNRTLAFSNVATKRPFMLTIQQDSTGGRTVTWPSGITWLSGVVPTLSPNGNEADQFMLIPKADWVASSNEVYWGIEMNNKRVKRITTVTSSTTPTPNADGTDEYVITALAGNATFGAPTGTPTQGQPLLIRIKDDGTSRTLGFNSIYRFPSDIPAPSATQVNKTMYLGFIYNSTDTKWDCVAYIDGY